MSILLPNEIPDKATLQQMPPDDLKHLADRHAESYRILRTAYLELISAHKALQRGIFPDTWRPEQWEKEGRVLKLDDDRLAACSPMSKLQWMDLQSRFWFGRWGQREAEIEFMRARLVERVGEESKEDIRMRLEKQAMIR